MSNDDIRVDDEQELRAWARALNATPEALRTAVETVGGSPEAVLSYLARQPKTSRQRWEWEVPSLLVGGTPQKMSGLT